MQPCFIYRIHDNDLNLYSLLLNLKLTIMVLLINEVFLFKNRGIYPELPYKYSKFMMTSSNGNIFRVTGHLCGEFTGPR